MSLSPGGRGPQASAAAGQTALRKRGKLEVCDAFLARLRERESFDLDDFDFVEGVQQHFKTLPSRYALDVNIASLDVLNHKRLLDSARADPSALSFQVRPIDVLSATGPHADPSRRPSFSSSDAPLTEVPHLSFLCLCLDLRAVSAPQQVLHLVLWQALAAAGRGAQRAGFARPAFGSSPNLQASTSWDQTGLDKQGLAHCRKTSNSLVGAGHAR